MGKKSFNFGDANDAQKEAIQTVDGPVLITAGPGTGKTYMLVQRTIYLIQECNVKPEQIFVATFTEKAAKELVTRITNELVDRKIPVNVSDMYIGTFHSLCLRIIKDNLEYTRLKQNYTVMEPFDQQYLVFRNINLFRSIENFDKCIPARSTWRKACDICGYVNTLSEEMVDCEKLANDEDPVLAALGNIQLTYQELLRKRNLIDFSSIQTECYKLLKENPPILEKLQNQIKYMMIDEYQDTNYIQEKLVFLLGEKHQNICVVGDDDQGLYRFRGATIRNILEFPGKFNNTQCKIISLDINYRSDSDIVDFYNKWMDIGSKEGYEFNWDKYRYDKQIKPHEPKKIKSPGVVKLAAYGNEDEWHKRILDFIIDVKNSGEDTDYNQIAFLCKSVKNDSIVKLESYLEEHGIHVYSPRSDMFFERDEIRLAIGSLMMMFPKYVSGLEQNNYKFLNNKEKGYYYSCKDYAEENMERSGNEELREFIYSRAAEHENLWGTTDYTYTGLLYELFQFHPFRDMLDTELNTGVVDVRPVRNLALLTQIIGQYEHLNNIDVLSGKSSKGERKIDKDTEILFNLYLRLRYEEGIPEYEDETEYAPSGCVSFMTIHQSKGLEFPIVIVDSLWDSPRDKKNTIIRKVEEKGYFNREEFEPHDKIKYFDFWRLYYTAFSRAQDLLVLTCNENDKSPSKYFTEIYKDLQDVSSPRFHLDEFDFQHVKDVTLKNTFSFTSHISVYEACPKQYKFYKELEFAPVRQGTILFGTLVHQTIEDIHRAAKRGEADLITEEKIKGWFDSNYSSLSESEHSYLGRDQQKAALDQVHRYVERQNGDWSMIKEVEVDVTLFEPDYIIEGRIDLIRGDGDTVELLDFKSEHKPDFENDSSRYEHYKQQLEIYAHLVEQRMGYKVSMMHLYYTGEEGDDPTVDIPYVEKDINETVEAFDKTVKKIMKKDFSHDTKDKKTCQNCDFRYYCGKVK